MIVVPFTITSVAGFMLRGPTGKRRKQMKNKKLNAMRGALLTAAIALSGGASALVVEGSGNGTFVNPVGPAGMITTGVGTNAFSWGSGAPPSSMTFIGSAFSSTLDTFFDIGALTYYNGSITAGTQADSVDLLLGIAFTAPTGVSQSFSYLLNLINTPNTGTPQDAADIIQFASLLPTQTFTIGTTAYTVELQVGETGPSGFSTQNTFSVIEGQSATATLRARVTAAEVPVPAPLALLLMGLVSLGVARRF